MTDIHLRRYLNDQEQAQQNSPNETPISRMRNYCGSSNFKYDQEPILFKPMIKDMIHGGTYDRVFSKTVAYKSQELRCSNGIIMPRQFLDLMSAKQKEIALKLSEQGLLIVSICSATTYFSKQNKLVKQAKTQTVQSDIMKAFLPEDIAVTENPSNQTGAETNSKMPRKLFVNVVQLAQEDQDLVKLPQWVIKALGMAGGQPLAVSLPKWPGSLHFYDAKTVELTPNSPIYYQIVDKYQDRPDLFSKIIKKGLSRHKLLTHGTDIEVLLNGKVIRAKIRLESPSEQLWLLNNDYKSLNVKIRITRQLEKLASLEATSMDKFKRDNVRNLKEGLDLDQVMKLDGLDLDKMEQLEQEHIEKVQKLKAMSYKPKVLGQSGNFSDSNFSKYGHEMIKLQDSAAEMDKVSEVTNEQHSQNEEFQRRSLNHFTNQTLSMEPRNYESAQLGQNHIAIEDLLCKKGDEGTMSKLYPTIKINARTLSNMQTAAYVGNSPDSYNRQLVFSTRNFGSQSSNLQTSNHTRGQTASQPPSHQRALDRAIHTFSPNILRLDSKDNLALYTTQVEDGQTKAMVLSQLPRKPIQSSPLRKQDKNGQRGFVVPYPQTANTILHQQSIVTASMRESSKNHNFDYNTSSFEEKKTPIFTVLKDKESLNDSNKFSKKQSMQNVLHQLLGQNPPGGSLLSSDQFQFPYYTNSQTDMLNNPHSLSNLIKKGQSLLEVNPIARLETDQPVIEVVDIKTRANIDNAQSNQELIPVKDFEFLKLKKDHTGSMATESVDQLIKPMQYEVIQDKRYRGLHKNETLILSEQNRQLSNNSNSNNDIQSELMVEVMGHGKTPVYYRNDGSEQGCQDLEIQEADLRHMSSAKLIDERDQKTTETQRSSVLQNSKHNMDRGSRTGQRGNLCGRSSLSGPASVLNKNRIIDSQQSVFERLSDSRNVIKSMESAGGEEFKKVLKIIENANPDQYRHLVQRHQVRLCSKRHPHDAALQMLDSKVYKLDESEQMAGNLDTKQRARSSYGLNRKRSLVQQLKQNDLLLERGITGSPVALPLGSHGQLKDFLSKKGSGDQATAITSNPTATLIISQDSSKAKIFMLGAKGQKLVSLKDLEAKKLLATNPQQFKIKTVEKANENASRQMQQQESRNQNQKLNNTVPMQRCVGPVYRAVINRKFNYNNGERSTSRKQGLSVKTGDLSKLFQSYNRKMTQQRQAVELKTMRVLSPLSSNRDSTPYRLDAKHPEVKKEIKSRQSKNRSRSRRRGAQYQTDGSKQRKQVQRHKTAEIYINQQTPYHQHGYNRPTETALESISCHGHTQHQSQHQFSNDHQTSSHTKLNTIQTIPMPANGSEQRVQERVFNSSPPPPSNCQPSVLESFTNVNNVIAPELQNIVDSVNSCKIKELSSVEKEHNKDGEFYDLNDSIQVDETIVENSGGPSKQHECISNAFMQHPVQMVDSLHQVHSTTRQSQTGDALLGEGPTEAMHSTFTGGRQKAMIEINVNKLEVEQQLDKAHTAVQSTQKQSQDQQWAFQTKQSGEVPVSITSVGEAQNLGKGDIRVNHDCFPANRYKNKRGSVLSNKQGFYQVNSLSPSRRTIAEHSYTRNRIQCQSQASKNNKKSRKSRKSSTVAQDAISVNNKIAQANLYTLTNERIETTGNQDKDKISEKQRISSVLQHPSQIVPLIPNLAVKTIMVRTKKLQDSIMRQDESAQISQLENPRSPSDTNGSFMVKKEDLSEFQRILFSDDASQNRSQIRANLAPKKVDKVQPLKNNSKVNWQIVKQQNVASPSSHDSSSAVFYSSRNTKQKIRPQVASVGRRLKGLKTLIKSENPVPDIALASPRTEFSGQNCLGTQQIVLSQRSLGQPTNILYKDQTVNKHLSSPNSQDIKTK